MLTFLWDDTYISLALLSASANLTRGTTTQQAVTTTQGGNFFFRLQMCRNNVVAGYMVIYKVTMIISFIFIDGLENKNIWQIYCF